MPTSRATGDSTLLYLTASLGLAGAAQAEGEADMVAGHAAFALERILAIASDDASARIQLAQAQKNLGELTAARQTLKSGLNNTSAQDRQAANNLLADLERRPAERSRTTSYVELGLGYDSNSNAATSSSLVDTGYGFPLPVTPGFTNRADNFASLAGGIESRLPNTGFSYSPSEDRDSHGNLRGGGGNFGGNYCENCYPNDCLQCDTTLRQGPSQ